MGFLTPKAPKPVTPATPPTPAAAPIRFGTGPNSQMDFSQNPASLISTSPSGLKRKALVNKVSLIGG